MKKLACTLLVVISLYACRKSAADNPPGIIADLSFDSLQTVSVNIPGDYYTDLAFFDGNTGLAVSRTGKIIKTTDGGNNWSQAAVPALSGLSLQQLQLTDNHTGYAMGHYYPNATLQWEGVLLKTTDAGNNWTRVGNTGQAQFYGMHFFDNQHGFLSGYRLYKTTDGGQTWTMLSKPAMGVNKIKFSNNSDGVLTAQNGIFYKTTDGGATWDSTKTSYSDILYDIYFTGSQTFVTRLGFPSLIDVNNTTAISPKPFEAKKLLFLDDRKCIGAGELYSPGASLTVGAIYLTNDGWNTSQQKIIGDAISITAIAKMSDHKIMMLGTMGSTIPVLVYHY